jgi:hypothetical protein
MRRWSGRLASWSVAQGEVIVMAGPAQVERPAAGGGEVDDRRARAAGHLPSHGLVCAVEGGLNTERGKWPPGNHLGDPEDLVVHFRERGGMQRIVIGPENGDDIPAVTHDVGHGQRRRVESGPCPGGEGVLDYRRRAALCCGRDGFTGGAACCRDDCQQDQRNVPPPHTTSVRLWVPRPPRPVSLLHARLADRL